MQTMQTTSVLRCSHCGQCYELADTTVFEGNQLPWLVVPEEVKTVEEAIARAICQRCLSFQGASERGLMAQLEALGVTIIKTSNPAQPLIGLATQALRAPGFAPLAMPVAQNKGQTLPTMPTMGRPVIGFSGLPTVPQGTSGPINLGMIAGTGILDALTSVALEGARAEEVAEEKRRRQLARERREAPLRVKLGETLAGELQQARRDVREQQQRRYEERLQAIKDLVADLKRTRARKVMGKLKGLHEALVRFARVDPKKRDHDDVLEQLIGLKPGWLSERFSHWVVCEILEDIQTELSVTFESHAEVRDLLDIAPKRVQVAAYTRLLDRVAVLLDTIRDTAHEQNVDEPIEELIGWATYFTMLGLKDRDDRDMVLARLGTSMEELEDLKDLHLCNLTAVPSTDGEGGSGSGTFQKRERKPHKGECFTRKVRVDGHEIEVDRFARTRLVEAAEPLPHVPAGTQAVVGLIKITYPEGDEYGSEPTINYPEGVSPRGQKVEAERKLISDALHLLLAGVNPDCPWSHPDFLIVALWDVLADWDMNLPKNMEIFEIIREQVHPLRPEKIADGDEICT